MRFSNPSGKSLASAMECSDVDVTNACRAMDVRELVPSLPEASSSNDAGQQSPAGGDDLGSAVYVERLEAHGYRYSNGHGVASLDPLDPLGGPVAEPWLGTSHDRMRGAAAADETTIPDIRRF